MLLPGKFPLMQAWRLLAGRIDRKGEFLPLPIPAILRSAHGVAVRCPLPGKFPLMQAWRLFAGRIAQKTGTLVYSIPAFLTYSSSLFSRLQNILSLS